MARETMRKRLDDLRERSQAQAASRAATARQNNGKEAIRKTDMPTGARRDQETPGLFVTPAPGSSRRESIQPAMETIN